MYNLHIMHSLIPHEEPVILSPIQSPDTAFEATGPSWFVAWKLQFGVGIWGVNKMILRNPLGG